MSDKQLLRKRSQLIAGAKIYDPDFAHFEPDWIKEIKKEDPSWSLTGNKEEYIYIVSGYNGDVTRHHRAGFMMMARKGKYTICQ